MIKIAEPNIGILENTQVLLAMKNSMLSGVSPIVGQFERAFALKTGRKYAVSCNSGSSALMLALMALKPKYVLIPDFAYIAVTNACKTTATPFFLRDVDDKGNIQDQGTRGNKHVLAVHTYGHVYQGECLIEDAAEAIGRQTNKSKITCFSFFANKTITTGEGGMCTTDSPTLYKRLLSLRDNGNSRKGLKRYYSEDIGYSMAMSGLQASLGYAQLQRLDEFLSIKQSIVGTYDNLLFRSAPARPGRLPIQHYGGAWMYGILLKNAKTRDALMRYLFAHGVESRNFFPPIHTQKKYKHLFRHSKFPQSTYLANHGLYLPSGTTLNDGHILHISNLIIKFFRV